MRIQIAFAIVAVLLVSCTTVVTYTSTETPITKTDSPTKTDFPTRIPSPVSTFTPTPSIWQIWFRGYSCEGVPLCGEGQPPPSSYFSINSDGTALRPVEIFSIPTPQLPADAPPLPDGFSSVPQVSPDKSMLTYGARENGVFCLYLVDTQTGETTKLYQTQTIEDHLFWIGTACWSSDGDTIDFMLHSRVGMDNQPPVMYRINRDGSNIQALYSFPGLENAWFGACSPDGKEVALSIGGNTEIESNGLYLINRDTGQLKQILSSFFAITVELPQK
jgi:Tol biopolymer transport system component